MKEREKMKKETVREKGKEKIHGKNSDTEERKERR